MKLKKQRREECPLIAAGADIRADLQYVDTHMFTLDITYAR